MESTAAAATYTDMEATCLRHTEIPHTSRLFADFLYHHDRVERFYAAGEPAADYPVERRAALVRALREQNGDHPALEVLARPGAVAVVTGQQVGLFSGPCYTIYKALTAVKAAERLCRQGRPAVPVFWLATEDHDFAEVNHTWVFDQDGRPLPLSVDGRAGNESPVGTLPIGRWPMDDLRQAFRNLPCGDEVSALVAESYRGGRTLGESFQALLERLLRPYGLLFIDPLRPAVRDIAAPLLGHAVRAADQLTAKLLARNQELAAAGYHAQVHFEPNNSLFFLLEGDRRIALRRQNGSYFTRDRRYSPAEIADRAELLSPNALLRPVVQDYILPTATYIGGPAELAYLAQSQVIYADLLGHMPRPVPRNGFTLLDQRCRKLLARYRLRIQDLFHGEEPLRDRIAREIMPPDLMQEFANARTGVARITERLDTALRSFDPSLASSLEKSRAKILYQIAKQEAKASHEALRRNDRAAADAAFLGNSIFPHKHLQERFYSLLPFLARHGLDLIPRLYEAVRLDCPDHMLLAA